MLKESNFSRSLTAIGSVLVLVVANNLGWVAVAGILQDTASPLSRPLARAGQNVGLKIYGLGGWKSGEKTLRLEQENQRLTAELSRLNSLEQENQQLRDNLGFDQKKPYRQVGADIIGFQPGGGGQIIQINRGTDSGIAIGMPVVSQGYLVGKIGHTAARSSHVVLINDPAFRVLVVGQTSGAEGIVKGQVGSGLIMEKIPQNQNLKPDEIVVSSGLDGEYPRGLIIGTVNNITQDSQSIFQAAQISQKFEATRLRVLLVITAKTP